MHTEFSETVQAAVTALVFRVAVFMGGRHKAGHDV